MINEGDAHCIVYQMKPAGIPEDIKSWKISGKKVKKEDLTAVIEYMDNNCTGELSEFQNEILKRPFTNELISKELDIVKKNNKNIVDIVYVTNAGDAYCRFNKFIHENKDKYEPQYWMCGDDRIEKYQKSFLDHYAGKEIPVDKDGNKLPNELEGKLELNTGKGRTEGVSGTEVRKCVIQKDKQKFLSIMPKGTDRIFDDLCKSFDDFKTKIQKMVSESKFVSLKNYLLESLK